MGSRFLCIYADGPRKATANDNDWYTSTKKQSLII